MFFGSRAQEIIATKDTDPKMHCIPILNMNAECNRSLSVIFV